MSHSSLLLPCSVSCDSYFMRVGLIIPMLCVVLSPVAHNHLNLFFLVFLPPYLGPSPPPLFPYFSNPSHTNPPFFHPFLSPLSLSLLPSSLTLFHSLSNYFVLFSLYPSLPPISFPAPSFSIRSFLIPSLFLTLSLPLPSVLSLLLSLTIFVSHPYILYSVSFSPTSI